MKRTILRLTALTLCTLLLLTGSSLALTLRYKDEGEAVRKLQTALRQLGYYTRTVDGQYGAGTREAVRAFQRRYSLAADGVAGEKTIARLTSLTGVKIEGDAPAGASGLFGGDYTTLKAGMRGEQVRILQQALKDMGFAVTRADGIFGTATTSAVKAFQRAVSLTADGKAGPATLKKMETYFDEDGRCTGTPLKPQSGSSGSSALPARTLRQGMSGEDVALLQTRLIDLGYLSGRADGMFGAGTKAALVAFQKANRLTADGVCGASTRARLFSDAALPAPEDDPDDDLPQEDTIPARTLRQGMSGEDVALLQTRLIDLGYLSGRADGMFGAGTKAALVAFQKANRLSADGVCGASTRARLFSDTALPAPEDDPDDDLPQEDTIPARTLSVGDSGEDVRSVQQRLRALGFLTGAADGQYGSATAAAMKAFQQMNSLTATGSGSQAAYARLYSDDAINAMGVHAGQSVPAYTNLTFGARGTAVIRLQQRLEALRYTVQVTGVFDETTCAAVLAFQQRNGLSADGIAGKNTQQKLYGSGCVTGDTPLPGGGGSSTGSGSSTGGGSSAGSGSSAGGVIKPALSQVKWLMWYDEIKPTIRSGQSVLVYEPASGSNFYLKLYSLGRHADSEPLTAQDTAIMKAAWGGSFSWKEKPVYVRLPNGVWCIASMHSMPHLSGSLSNNDFAGHLCVHFPRTIEECISSGDSKNGVRHQNDIRKHWLQITGETIPW